MTDPTPPDSDDEAMSAIARVLGQPEPTSTPLPPPPTSGVDGEGVAGPPDPPSGDQAPDGPAETPSVGPSSIVLRPTGTAAPVAVTRRHLYGAIAAGILAAALIAAGVAALVARDTTTATAAAAPAPTTNPEPATTTTSTSTTSTVPAPVPVELSTATVTLPYPATKASTGAFGAIAKPGELVVVPKQNVISGEPGTASWQWESCIKNDCTPVNGATGDGYRVPADAKAGTTVRAALTITPKGQAGPVTVRSKKVTIV